MILPRYQYDGYGNVIKERDWKERIGVEDADTFDVLMNRLLDEIEKKQDAPAHIGVMIT